MAATNGACGALCSKKRGVPWTVAILTLAMTASLISFYEVHQHQSGIIENPIADPYVVTDLADEQVEMDETLRSLNDMLGEATGGVDVELEESMENEDDVASGLSLTDAVCHAEPHAEYDGHTVVKWGSSNILASASDCCTACTINPDCNVWVFCPLPGGCGTHKFGECWLKKSSMKGILDSEGMSEDSVPWISGSIYNEEKRKEIEQAEKDRLARLANDPELPMVYLDITIKNKPIGRIKIVLFTKESPRAAENFRALCTGEKGIVPSGKEGEGRPYHFKGSTFYRIVDRFINQSGANTESVFGGKFKDDLGGLALKHDRKGLLSMANAGPDTNTSHFSILMAPAPHLDARYTIFGEIVEGLEVAEQINSLSRGKPNNSAGPEEQAVIADCGQLR